MSARVNRHKWEALSEFFDAVLPFLICCALEVFADKIFTIQEGVYLYLPPLLFLHVDAFVCVLCGATHA